MGACSIVFSGNTIRSIIPSLSIHFHSFFLSHVPVEARIDRLIPGGIDLNCAIVSTNHPRTFPTLEMLLRVFNPSVLLRKQIQISTIKEGKKGRIRCPLTCLGHSNPRWFVWTYSRRSRSRSKTRQKGDLSRPDLQPPFLLVRQSLSRSP